MKNLVIFKSFSLIQSFYSLTAAGKFDERALR